MPRQGIEPCIYRLKAGGFTIEACEAFRARSSERGARNERSKSRSLFVFVRCHSALRVPNSTLTVRFRGLESNQRHPPSKGGISTSTESPESITLQRHHQLPGLESNQRRPPSEGGISTSTESPAIQATHDRSTGRYPSAAVVGIEPTNYALTGRRLTIRLHTAVREKTPSAGHLGEDARPMGAEPCSVWHHPVRMLIWVRNWFGNWLGRLNGPNPNPHRCGRWGLRGCLINPVMARSYFDVS